MTLENAGLRRATFGILLAAFVFGILTLWIRAQWPFAVFAALVCGAACAWFVAAVLRPRVAMSAWLALPFGVSALGAAQIAFGVSQNVWLTRQASLEWFVYGCVAVAAFQVARDEHLRLLALRVFALGAGALAVLAVAQNRTAPGRVLWVFDTAYPDLVFGPFVYHTKLANFAELAIPAALWLAVTERRGRALYALSAVALVGAVVASASRGGLVVSVLEIFVVAALTFRTHLRGRGAAVAVAFGLALVSGAAIFGWDLMRQRFAANDPAADLRLPMMATSVDMARRYWLFGSGLGTWPGIYPEWARFDAHIRINQAHSDWLQWLVEGGIVLPACVLAMLAGALVSVRRHWWLLGVVFVLLHGAIDYPMQQTPALAALLVAVWAAGTAATRTAASRSVGVG